MPTLVDAAPAGGFEAGLPTGVIDRCTGLALAMGALTGMAVSGVGTVIQVRLPEVMASAYGSTNRMRPAAPSAVGSGGWVHADLGAPGDGARFDALLSTLPPSASAAEVAAAAQEWRLPVCDYRPRSGPGLEPWTFQSGTVATAPGRRRPRVLDLTNMWAGPLATWLLASLGWSVTKVEPSFRPDGFRAFDHGGIHPADRPCDPGRDSGMWNALNHGKEILDLDLRAEADRARFVDLAAESDVVIDSFSPRVMPNFGLSLPEGPVYVSLPAFPPGPQRDWVAYGTGVHAVSGLGDGRRGREGAGGEAESFAAPAVAYPDPVGGFTAAVATVAALDAARRGRPVAAVECSLFSAVQPLLAHPTDLDQVSAPTDEIGSRLLAAGLARGAFVGREVCGRDLLHPGGIFHPR